MRMVGLVAAALPSVDETAITDTATSPPKPKNSTAFDVSDPFKPHAIPLGELALPSGKLRHPAGRVAHAWRVFLARIPIPSDYQSACQVCWPWQPIALKARRGAICQSLLCFRKRPLILKQLIF
jgi:hypothetical protein